MVVKNFRFLDHTADIKFKAYGKSLNEAYGNVVLAVAEVLAKENKIKSGRKVQVELEGSDRKNLLYNFIEELIYLLDAEGFVVKSGKVKISGNKLNAELIGDDSKNYKGLDHIKAATYAEMIVRQGKKGWEVQAVVDV